MLNQAMLGAALGCDGAALSWERIGGQAHEGTVGVYRVSGAPSPVVVKLMRPGADERLCAQVARELSVYEDDSLQGVVRPARCLGRIDPQDGVFGVLLEDLSGVHVVPWDEARYLAAAHALGESQRAWTGREHGYDGRSAIRSVCSVPVIVDAIAGVDRAALSADRFFTHWDARFDLFARLDRLPSVLSHGDFHNENVFVVAEREAVAIDWAYAGPGALGEDLGCLYTSDFVFGRMDTDVWIALEDPIFEAFGGGDATLRHTFGLTAGFDAGVRLVFSLARGEAPADVHERLDAVERLLAEAEPGGRI